MTDKEMEVLKREEPPGHPSVGIFGPCHPLEGRVVRQQGELMAQEVIAKLQDCPFDGQSFLLHGSVVFLGRGQLSANIQYGVLFSLLDLRQDGPQSCV